MEWGIKNWRWKSLSAVISRLTRGSTIYHLWLQRNRIIHGGQVKTEEGFVQIIILKAKVCVITRLSFKNSFLDRVLFCAWGIPP